MGEEMKELENVLSALEAILNDGVFPKTVYDCQENARKAINDLKAYMEREGLKPRILGSFKSYQDWVNRATRELAYFKHEYGHKVDAMCVDSIGRRCTCGGDFARARDENTFPVYYFIDCEAKENNDDISSNLRCDKK